ncbi:CCHC-type domain-containing protein [Nephila pilipes]|uniref:CCHC-type domain-containing protein n=1 Tax=Nephila pilipes TaxID=299642 RepID=A0A8X6U2Y1_NEPPI|nr:CCHC-type domain-containing protein [Nephila pilipes]
MWFKITSSRIGRIVETLDDYDTLKLTFKGKQLRKDVRYDKRKSLKDDPVVANNEKKKLNSITHNEIGELKYLNCNNFGYISRDCPLPKPVIIWRKCYKTGNKAKNFISKSEENYSNDGSLSVEHVRENSEESAYLKKA